MRSLKYSRQDGNASIQNQKSASCHDHAPQAEGHVQHCEVLRQPQPQGIAGRFWVSRMESAEPAMNRVAVASGEGVKGCGTMKFGPIGA